MGFAKTHLEFPSRGFSMDLLRIVDVRFNFDGNIMFAAFSSDFEFSIYACSIFDGLFTDVFPVSIFVWLLSVA